MLPYGETPNLHNQTLKVVVVGWIRCATSTLPLFGGRISRNSRAEAAR
jgi:hypothetical protein